MILHIMPAQDLILNYNVPIAEAGMMDQDFIIQGIAINATLTANNHKFLPEELRSSAATLTGVPLLVDHDNRVESIKGRVMVGEFDEMNPRVKFKAKVMDENIKNMIRNGLLNTVSIGAAVKDLEEGEDGIITPRGIVFKELSLVAVPADAGATFAKAMFEAYNLKKISSPKIETTGFAQVNEEDMMKCKECGKMVAKDKMKAHMDKMHEEESDSSLSIDNKMLKGGLNIMSEKEVTKVEQKMEAVAEKFTTDPKILELLTKLTEKVIALEKSKEEVKESEVEEKEELPSNSKYKIVQGYGSLRGDAFTIVRN